MDCCNQRVITCMFGNRMGALLITRTYCSYLPSLAASPSPPGRSSGRAAKPRAEGGEGLANIALDHVSLECQLHVPVNR